MCPCACVLLYINIVNLCVFQDVASKRTEKRCYIYVTDVNDMIPDFSSSLSEDNYIELSVKEGNYAADPAPGNLIGKVQAIDADGTAPNNQVQFFICNMFENLVSTSIIDGEIFVHCIAKQESLSVSRFIHLPIKPSTYLFICLTILPFISISVYLSIHLFIHLTFHPSMHPSIYPVTH